MKVELIAVVTSFIAKITLPIFFAWIGNKISKSKVQKNDAKILQDQRDNDIDDLPAARKLMRKLRKKR